MIDTTQLVNGVLLWNKIPSHVLEAGNSISKFKQALHKWLFQMLFCKFLFNFVSCVVMFCLCIMHLLIQQLDMIFIVFCYVCKLANQLVNNFLQCSYVFVFLGSTQCRPWSFCATLKIDKSSATTIIKSSATTIIFALLHVLLMQLYWWLFMRCKLIFLSVYISECIVTSYVVNISQ